MQNATHQIPEGYFTTAPLSSFNGAKCTVDKTCPEGKSGNTIGLNPAPSVLVFVDKDKVITL
jgi:hypothetical protein